jgi:hypothetical protein
VYARDDGPLHPHANYATALTVPHHGHNAQRAPSSSCAPGCRQPTPETRERHIPRPERPHGGRARAPLHRAPAGPAATRRGTRVRTAPGAAKRRPLAAAALPAAAPQGRSMPVVLGHSQEHVCALQSSVSRWSRWVRRRLRRRRRAQRRRMRAPASDAQSADRLAPSAARPSRRPLRASAARAVQSCRSRRPW